MIRWRVSKPSPNYGAVICLWPTFLLWLNPPLFHHALQWWVLNTGRGEIEAKKYTDIIKIWIYHLALRLPLSFRQTMRKYTCLYLWTVSLAEFKEFRHKELLNKHSERLKAVNFSSRGSYFCVFLCLCQTLFHTKPTPTSISSFCSLIWKNVSYKRPETLSFCKHQT